MGLFVPSLLGDQTCWSCGPYMKYVKLLCNALSDACILPVVSTLRVQLSQPSRRVNRTRALYSRILVEKLMFLQLQILFYLAMLAVAMVNIVLMASVERLSFVSMAPSYLKVVNSPSCCLFMLICVVVFSPLLTMALLFCCCTPCHYTRALFDNNYMCKFLQFVVASSHQIYVISEY